jgi:hypothetical protein
MYSLQPLKQAFGGPRPIKVIWRPKARSLFILDWREKQFPCLKCPQFVSGVERLTLSPTHRTSAEVTQEMQLRRDQHFVDETYAGRMAGSLLVSKSRVASFSGVRSLELICATVAGGESLES